MKAYNTSVHEGTKYIPYELVFGKAARVLTSSTLPDDKGNESYSKYATTLFKQIFDTQASAYENFEHAKIRSKQYYERKANLQIFNKDYVYLLKEPLPHESFIASTVAQNRHTRRERDHFRSFTIARLSTASTLRDQLQWVF